MILKTSYLSRIIKETKKEFGWKPDSFLINEHYKIKDMSDCWHMQKHEGVTLRAREYIKKGWIGVMKGEGCMVKVLIIGDKSYNFHHIIFKDNIAEQLEKCH
jgi:hypothetical protein